MPRPTVAVYVSRLLSADVISGAFQGVRLIPKFGVGEFDGSGGGRVRASSSSAAAYLPPSPPPLSTKKILTGFLRFA